MLTIFEDKGLLANKAPNKKSSNPWETHYFEYPIVSTDTVEEYEIIISTEYYLSGNIPLDVTIDNNGLLKGEIRLLNEQTMEFEKHKKEDIKIDGSNWLNNGRPKAAFIDFDFKVHKKITYEYYYKDLDMDTFDDENDLNLDGYDDIKDLDMDGIDDTTEELLDTKLYKIMVYEESTNVIIKVIKNNNIDNYVFVKNYMDQGNTLKIGNDEYTKKHINLFIQVHPGPFK